MLFMHFNIFQIEIPTIPEALIHSPDQIFDDAMAG